MRFQKPPQSPCRINMSHPHAEGLTAAYLMNDYGCSTVTDYVNNNQQSVVGGSFVDGGYLPSLSGNHIKIDNTDGSLLNLTQGTVIVRIKPLNVATDNARRNIFGQWGSSYQHGDFVIRKETDNNLYFVIRDVTTRYVILNSANYASIWQPYIQIAIQWDANNNIYDGKKLAINLNGNYYTPDISTATSDVTLSSLHDYYSIGNDYDDLAYPANSIIELTYIYNHVLPESLLKIIYKKPYAMAI